MAGRDAGRLGIGLWTGSAWAPLSCAIDRGGPLLACSTSQLGQFAILVAPTTDGVPDLDLPNGRFFKQANGFSGAGTAGFSVTDDDTASLWSEFQRLGGVAELGYPVSDRFIYHGFVTQAFQRAALQWDRLSGAAVRVNLLDDLRQRGSDDWLQAAYHSPVLPQNGDDPNLSRDELVASHVGEPPDLYPPLREFYDAQTDALERYGLPMAVRDYGSLVSVRLQRGTLQLWTVDKPWAAAGTVVVGNAGDLAKEAGLWPLWALAPRPAPILMEGQR